MTKNKTYTKLNTKQATGNGEQKQERLKASKQNRKQTIQKQNERNTERTETKTKQANKDET